MTTLSLSAIEYVFVKFANRNCSNPTQYYHREFVSTYGVSVQVSAKIWLIIKSEIQDNKIAKGLRPCHLLWCLYFLKQYSTSTTMARYCGCSDKTFRKWTWIVIELLAELCDKNVSNFFSIICMHYEQLNLPIPFRFCCKSD